MFRTRQRISCERIQENISVPMWTIYWRTVQILQSIPGGSFREMTVRMAQMALQETMVRMEKPVTFISHMQRVRMERRDFRQPMQSIRRISASMWILKKPTALIRRSTTGVNFRVRKAIREIQENRACADCRVKRESRESKDRRARMAKPRIRISLMRTALMERLDFLFPIPTVIILGCM